MVTAVKLLRSSQGDPGSTKSVRRKNKHTHPLILIWGIDLPKTSKHPHPLFIKCWIQCLNKAKSVKIRIFVFLTKLFLVSDCIKNQNICIYLFDFTIESFLFGIRWIYVVPQRLFASEWFVTQTAKRLNFCVDWTARLWSLREVSREKKKFSTNVAEKFSTHFSDRSGVLLLLCWLAVTDRFLCHGWIWFWDTGKLLINRVPKSSSFRSFTLAKKKQGLFLAKVKERNEEDFKVTFLDGSMFSNSFPSFTLGKAHVQKIL